MTDLTGLTSLQDRKLDPAFAHLDVDGDGQIEHEDVLALGARLLIGFGEAPTSTRAATSSPASTACGTCCSPSSTSVATAATTDIISARHGSIRT